MKSILMPNQKKLYHPNFRKMTEIAIQDMGGTSLHTMEVNGFTHPPFFKSGDEIRNIFDNMPNLQFRDNDILLLTFQKTGRLLEI